MSKPSPTGLIGKSDTEDANRDQPQKQKAQLSVNSTIKAGDVLDSVFWEDEMKIKMYQSDGKWEVWRKR